MMKNAKLLTLLAVLSASTASHAQQANPQAVYRPGDVNLEHSRVYAFVDKGGMIGHTHAVMGRLKQGRLSLGAPQQAGELVIDMPSFDADSDLARRYIGLEGSTADWMRKQINDHMHGSKGLDTKRFTTAVFRIDSALPLPQPSQSGKAQFQLSGQFTLFGVTRPHQMVVEVESQQGWQHVVGVFSIKHSDFGRKPYSQAFGAVGIADEVKVWGDAWVAPGATNAVAGRPPATVRR